MTASVPRCPHCGIDEYAKNPLYPEGVSWVPWHQCCDGPHREGDRVTNRKLIFGLAFCDAWHAALCAARNESSRRELTSGGNTAG